MGDECRLGLFFNFLKVFYKHWVFQTFKSTYKNKN